MLERKSCFPQQGNSQQGKLAVLRHSKGFRAAQIHIPKVPSKVPKNRFPSKVFQARFPSKLLEQAPQARFLSKFPGQSMGLFFCCCDHVSPFQGLSKFHHLTCKNTNNKVTRRMKMYTIICRRIITVDIDRIKQQR